MKLTVHQIGPFPPPHGGVSTHLSRLHNRLLKDGHACTVWSRHHDPDRHLRSMPVDRQAIQTFPGEPDAIFHFHSKHYLAGQLARRGCKVLFTVHNERINEDFGKNKTVHGWWERKRVRGSFLKVPQLLAVSGRARDELITFGFPANVIKVVPAYLRPDDSELAHPQNLLEFSLFRQRHRFLLTACAWALKRHHGEDLYGIDLCVELIGKIAGKYDSVGLVLALPGSQGTKELHSLQRRVAQLGLEQQVLFLFEPGAFHPLMKDCDLFLRPTNTDGFSISIAEAFEYSVPVIASDVVPRPEGCLLFTNRNLDSLVQQTCYALEHLELLSSACSRQRVKDRYEEIVACYHSMVTQPCHCQGATREHAVAEPGQIA